MAKMSRDHGTNYGHDELVNAQQVSIPVKNRRILCGVIGTVFALIIFFLLVFISHKVFESNTTAPTNSTGFENLQENYLIADINESTTELGGAKLDNTSSQSTESAPTPKCKQLYQISNSTNHTTFRNLDVKPGKYRIDGFNPVSLRNYESPQTQIHKLRHYRRNKCTELLQSSDFPDRTIISDNGFVRTIMNCYNWHCSLVIRPDDVWAAIMTQFSFYINKHAEEFRGQFVNFEGKRELVVNMTGTLRSVPYAKVVKLMTEEIDKNLVDAEVKSWILPNFSTTTDNDLVTVGVIFMASMKKYFDYKSFISCGIPSITLLGTIEDWKDIHRRLGKLKEYKLEKWHDMLEPILTHFVSAKEGKVDFDFWESIVIYKSVGCGQRSLSGWITAFCTFDKDGNQREIHDSERKWPEVITEDIPTGIVEVDMKIIEGPAEYNSTLLAGHMGTEVSEDGGTAQPLLGWSIALKGEDAEEADDEYY